MDTKQDLNILSEQESINQDLDLWEEVREWRKSLPKLEEAQWLNIFTQAKKQYGKLIKGKLKIEKKYLIAKQEGIRHEAIRQASENDPSASWRDQIIRERRDTALHYCQKRIRTIGALLSLIGQNNKRGNQDIAKQKSIPITPEMIERARAYPLDQLVEINRQKFATCFAHKDSKPSAYCKGNFIHCFVCNKSWDTIAVCMERDGMSFREAVLKLQ